MTEFRLETERLVLRSWREADIDPFHAICSDPLVMATLGPLLSREQTAALIDRCVVRERELGFTFWAVERREDARLIGWCGVIRGNAGPVDGLAEIGWRLASDCWGRGYASEGARATVDWSFANLPDASLWAITNVDNLSSRAVMERLGMRRREDLDFDHPHVAADSPLVPHVTYQLARAEWRA